MMMKPAVWPSRGDLWAAQAPLADSGSTPTDSSIDAFIESVLVLDPSISLNSNLVPKALAKGFGLNTEPSMTEYNTTLRNNGATQAVKPAGARADPAAPAKDGSGRQPDSDPALKMEHDASSHAMRRRQQANRVGDDASPGPEDPAQAGAGTHADHHLASRQHNQQQPSLQAQASGYPSAQQLQQMRATMASQQQHHHHHQRQAAFAQAAYQQQAQHAQHAQQQAAMAAAYGQQAQYAGGAQYGMHHAYPQYGMPYQQYGQQFNPYMAQFNMQFYQQAAANAASMQAASMQAAMAAQQQQAEQLELKHQEQREQDVKEHQLGQNDQLVQAADAQHFSDGEEDGEAKAIKRPRQASLLLYSSSSPSFSLTPR
jgi:hypothetical protein